MLGWFRCIDDVSAWVEISCSDSRVGDLPGLDVEMLGKYQLQIFEQIVLLLFG